MFWGHFLEHKDVFDVIIDYKHVPISVFLVFRTVGQVPPPQVVSEPGAQDPLGRAANF